MSNLYQTLFLVLLFTFLGTDCVATDSPDMDSLSLHLQEARENKTTPQTLEAFYQLVEVANFERTWKKVIIICEEAIQFSEEERTFWMRGDFFYEIGKAYAELTKYEEAIDYFEQAVSLRSEDYRRKTLGDAYTELALIHRVVGNYQKSYEYYLHLLRVQEANKDSLKVTRTLYGIGCILFYQDNFSGALDYYKRALKISEQLGKEKEMSSPLAGIASVYIEKKEYEKALKYNFKSLEIAKKIDYKVNVAYVLQNIGSCYLGMGQLSKAEEYISQSIELKKILEDPWGLVGSYKDLARIYSQMERHDESIAILQEAMKIAEGIGSNPRKLNIYDIFIESYETAGDTEMANKYLHAYIELKDTLINESSVREMGAAKSGYEVKKREDKIALLTSQKELLEKEQKIKSLTYYLMGASLLFMLALTFIWFSRFRMQQRMVGLLEEKNDQIHRQNKQLELSNEDLQQFAYVASHDLKEPLRMISSYTTLLKKRYQHLFDDQAEEFMFYVVDAVGRMQVLLDDLLAYSRIETQKGNQKWIESIDVISIVSSNLRMAITEKNVDVKINYNQLPKINADRSQMIQLFQNLISNAIKFVDTDKPQVEVGFKKAKGKMALFVKDNGIGIDEKSKAKIFEMFHRLHTKEEFEGTGIGLATCKRIVDRHMGEIWVESEKGKGSTFFIALPEKDLAASELKMEPATIA